MYRITRWAVSCMVVILSLILSMAPVGATETVKSIPKINEVYPNAPGSQELGFEFIELYNSSTSVMDLSSYKIRIKDKSKAMSLVGQIEPEGYLSITTTFALVNGGETVQLWLSEPDKAEVLIEEVSYGSAANEEQSWSLFDTGWELAPVTSGLKNTKYADEEVVQIDVCPATPAIDESIPQGYYLDGAGNCMPLPAATPLEDCNPAIYINEILSDPDGLESLGGEFVELYNSSNAEQSLVFCEIKSSKSSQILSNFSVQDIMPAKSFRVLNLTDKLTNASGSVTLSGGNREDVVLYSGVTSGISVSFFDGIWELSNQPTPGAVNQRSVFSQELEVASASLADCGPGKYRSPETNRCRNITTASAELANCDAGQYRNPETNRCRKISTASATLTPCAADQERNPETNRCRKISTASTALKPCQEGYSRNPETNRCRKESSLASVGQAAPEDPQTSATSINTMILVTAVSLAGGYAIYEYRSEVGSALTRLRKSFAKGRPPD